MRKLPFYNAVTNSCGIKLLIDRMSKTEWHFSTHEHNRPFPTSLASLCWSWTVAGTYHFINLKKGECVIRDYHAMLNISYSTLRYSQYIQYNKHMYLNEIRYWGWNANTTCYHTTVHGISAMHCGNLRFDGFSITFFTSHPPCRITSLFLVDSPIG